MATFEERMTNTSTIVFTGEKGKGLTERQKQINELINTISNAVEDEDAFHEILELLDEVLAIGLCKNFCVIAKKPL